MALQRADLPSLQYWTSVEDEGGDPLCVPWKDELARLTAGLEKAFSDKMHCTVALLGPRGTGKTQMAIEVARDWINKERSVKYARASDIVFESHSSTRSVSQLDKIEQFVKPRLLIVDESHRYPKTEWNQMLMENIIDRRYADKKATLLLANLTSEAFKQHIGDTIWSRMSESGGTVLCDRWPSFRRRDESVE